MPSKKGNMDDAELAVRHCGTQEQPANPAGSPVLDDWRFPDIHDGLSIAGEFQALGYVSGHAKFAKYMPTLPVTEIDTDLKWLRCIDGAIYRLGCRHQPDALIVRAAYMAKTTLAYRCLENETGRHTLDGDVLELLNDVTIMVVSAPPEAVRSAAAVFADVMFNAGRDEVARGWRMLATDPSDKEACAVIAEWLLAGAASIKARAMVDGWCALANGKTFGVDLSDPIKAAHEIGKRAKEDNADPYKGDISDNLREVYVKFEEPTEGVVVIPAIGGKDSKTGKELAEEFKAITGKRIPLRSVPAMVPARKTLLSEFPYAERVIDVLLSDLEARDDIYFRPTVIVGSPGCGKSRLIRRLGEVIGVYVGRYDGSASEDNAIGGTARRWSTGEPCWPISVIRAAGHANAILHVDELDKSATAQRNGSTAHALLPMLEVETARRYPDPLLQSDVDISHVSFLLTVNDDSGLPAPLKDRLRILRMPNMGPEHVQAVADSIVAEIAKDRGVNVGWYPWLDGDELEIARRLLGDGSIRRLRAIVERLIAARDSRAPRH
jgi:hypothetical protein